VRPSVTDGLGADVVIKVVGRPETFELAVGLGRPGARIADVGVRGRPAALLLEDQWLRDITVTTGLVDTFSLPALLRLLAARDPPTRVRQLRGGV
jgi:alcohol dehydrogenase